MKIGDWNGGAGEKILLPVKANSVARERRIQARELARMRRAAGLPADQSADNDEIKFDS